MEASIIADDVAINFCGNGRLTTEDVIAFNSERLRQKIDGCAIGVSVDKNFSRLSCGRLSLIKAERLQKNRARPFDEAPKIFKPEWR